MLPMMIDLEYNASSSSYAAYSVDVDCANVVNVFTAEGGRRRPLRLPPNPARQMIDGVDYDDDVSYNVWCLGEIYHDNNMLAPVGKPGP